MADILEQAQALKRKLDELRRDCDALSNETAGVAMSPRQRDALMFTVVQLCGTLDQASQYGADLVRTSRSVLEGGSRG